MTLTEYLQNAVTELRACICDNEQAVLGVIWRCPEHGCDEAAYQRRALADHVEAMLRRHFPKEIAVATSLHGAHLGDGFSSCMAHCFEEVTVCNACGTHRCRELPPVAQLVSVVTGTSLPEGAQ